ncbi:MAG: hypothetical protein AAFU64_02375 [Bacteroidota bacterium]
MLKQLILLYIMCVFCSLLAAIPAQAQFGKIKKKAESLKNKVKKTESKTEPKGDKAPSAPKSEEAQRIEFYMKSVKKNMDGSDSWQNNRGLVQRLGDDLNKVAGLVKDYQGKNPKEAEKYVQEHATYQARYNEVVGEKNRTDELPRYLNAKKMDFSALKSEPNSGKMFEYEGSGQKFYQRIDSAFNRVEIEKNMQAALAHDPAYEARYVQPLQEEMKSYEAYLNAVYYPMTNGLIEKAYALKAEKPRQARIFLENADYICQAVGSLYPENSQFKSLATDVQKAKDQVLGELDAKIFTSALHKAQVGKVVFSAQKINVNQADQATLKQDFKPGDKIWGLAYFDAPLKELVGTSKVVLYVSVDGQMMYNETFRPSEAELKQSYLPLEILLNNGDYEYNEGKRITRALAKVSPRSHQVEIMLGPNYKPYAQASFTFDASTGLDKMKSILKAIQEAEIAKRRMPKAKIQNAQYEQLLKNAVLQKGLGTPLRAVLTSDWTVYKNDIGIPDFQRLFGMVALKAPNGNCHYKKVYLNRAYSGGGTYGPIKAIVDTPGLDEDNQLKCENVNK